MLEGQETQSPASDALLESASQSVPATPLGAEAQPTETPAAPAATPAAAPPVTPAQAAAVAEAKSRYEERLAQIIAKKRPEIANQSVNQEDIEFARQIREAKKYGTQAVLQAAGVNQQTPDIDELLGIEKPKPDKTVVALEKKLAALEERLASKDQETAEQARRQQLQAFEASEYGKINNFIKQSAKDFEYVAALHEVGVEKDIYSGLVNLYNNGYQPEYRDVAGLVEGRIEDLLDRLAATEKFKSWALKKYSAPSGAPTISKGMVGSGTPVVAPPNESDAENKARALKAAISAAEAELARRKKG